MEFWPPIEEARPLVSEAQALMDGPVKAAIAAHAEAIGASDDSPSPTVYELKRAMHSLGAEAGLYAPHVSEPLGGRGASLRASMYLQEEVFLRGFGGQQWVLGWTDGPSPMVEAATDRAVEEFVRPLMRAEITTAFALTEP